MIPSSAITDRDRLLFMNKLAQNVRLPHGLLVTPWESDFIASFVRSSRPSLWFTEPRKVATDRMRMKYGSEKEIGMPFPPAKSSPAKLPEADPDGCQFVIREAGQQQPCNAPAERMRTNGFRYCSDHADAVLRDLKRQGKTMHLVPFKP